MSINVATNVSSIHAQRDLRLSTNRGDDSSKKLSSGLRINSAKDDPSGLQISSRFTSQIKGLARSNRNSSEGEAVVSIAEGALAEDFSILSRIRQLAIQSANGVNSTADRKVMQIEVEKLCKEVSRIATDTSYGGASILMGKNHGLIGNDGRLSLQVGEYSNELISIDMSTEFTMSAMYADIGLVTDNKGWNSDENCFDISTADSAQSVLAAVDSYIEFIDSKRSEMGAAQNRLTSNIRSNEISYENHSDTRSRIRDTDYAEETSNLIAANTLQNATSQMLVQANAKPNLAVALLS
ncbi:MAG: flagellin [Succinivibrio sp.]